MSRRLSAGLLSFALIATATVPALAQGVQTPARQADSFKIRPDRVTPAAVAPVAVETLVGEKAAEFYGDQMPEHGQFAITIQQPAPEKGVMIPDFAMDQDTGQFGANVMTADGRLLRIYGLAVLSVPVPVPTRRFMPGDIIGQADIQTMVMPVAQIGPFAVTDTEALSGKQVRRVIQAGRPVMQQSVIEPLVVERGARVTLAYHEGPLNLTAPGKALTDGHAGQDVRVVNLASNKTITGIARADGLVEVSK